MGQTGSRCKSLLLRPTMQSQCLNRGVCDVPVYGPDVRCLCAFAGLEYAASPKYTWSKDHPFPKRCRVRSQEEARRSVGPATASFCYLRGTAMACVVVTKL